MKFKTVNVRFKAGTEDGLGEREFLVYPSTFIREPDFYGDVVAKGAFVDTLREWEESGKPIPGLFGHRTDDPAYFIAKGIRFGEDEHGWWVHGVFLEGMQKADETYSLVKQGLISELSFAFDVLDEGKVELEDGRKANELRKLKVYEFSFVPRGANPDTSVVAVKDAARVLAAKAGRVISAKNEENLKSAVTGLENSIEQIKNVLSQLGEASQGKATPDCELNTEELSGVNVEKAANVGLARALALEIELLTLKG